jgi:hypothetical protein
MNNDTREYIREVIKAEADRIRGRMIDSKIYGYPIDMDSISSLIVGAYYLGESDHTRIFVKKLCEDIKKDQAL